jgi:DNA-binding XRE family transcriptional regulator
MRTSVDTAYSWSDRPWSRAGALVVALQAGQTTRSEPLCRSGAPLHALTRDWRDRGLPLWGLVVQMTRIRTWQLASDVEHAGMIATMTTSPDLTGPIRIDWSPLAKERQRYRLSQRELATIAGVSRTTIWRMETGRTCPSVELGFRISRALGVPLHRLLRVEPR